MYIYIVPMQQIVPCDTCCKIGMLSCAVIPSPSIEELAAAVSHSPTLARQHGKVGQRSPYCNDACGEVIPAHMFPVRHACPHKEHLTKSTRTKVLHWFDGALYSWAPLRTAV